MDCLVGNAPFLVCRHTGNVYLTGTAWPIDHYIEEFRNGRLTPEINPQ